MEFQLVSGKKLGLETGDPKNFNTFDEFAKAVHEQMAYLIRISAIVTVLTQQVHRDVLQKPLASSLMEGCIESGQDLMSGGAKYNSGPGIIIAGTGDYANSMAAVKKLVFDDQSISMGDLCQALEKDFQGFDKIRNLCIKAPKYGNDDDYADEFAKEIIDFASQQIKSYDGLNSPMALGTLPVSSHVAQGLVVGALPSGRKAGLSLSDGISPSQGTDSNGPTAVIKSLDKINQEVSTVGVLHNMKLEPSLLSNEKGYANFTALLRSHNQLGGGHIQFNCVNHETLTDAQANPDDYRSLMVRVAGYSAFFVELCKDIQDEIISRSSQSQWG